MRRACLAAVLLLAAPATAGAETTWTEADKDGYGTSTRLASKVWHTLDDGRLDQGLMLPEQVWAPDFPPAEQPGFPLGEGPFSATPWSHAQYVRLARSIDAGRPVERPRIVAAHYGG